MSVALADQLQVWGFEGDFLIFSDGSLGFGLNAKPLNVECLSDNDVNAFAVQVSHFLNGLPHGIDIQFVQDITTGNEEILKSFELLSRNSQGEVVKGLAQKRIDHFRKLDEQGQISKHLLQVFVRRSLLGALFERPRFFSRSNRFADIAEDRLSTEIRSMSQLRDDLIQGFSSIGVSTAPMKSKEIFESMYWQWNPVRLVEPLAYNSDDIRSSVLFTDAAVSERGFSLADVHHRIISLKLLPEQTHAAMAQSLRQLPVGSRLFLSVHVPDQQKEMEVLQSQRRFAHAMVHGKQNGVSDLD